MPSSMVLVVMVPAARLAWFRRRTMREKGRVTMSQIGKKSAVIQTTSGTCG